MCERQGHAANGFGDAEAAGGTLGLGVPWHELEVVAVDPRQGDRRPSLCEEGQNCVDVDLAPNGAIPGDDRGIVENGNPREPRQHRHGRGGLVVGIE